MNGLGGFIDGCADGHDGIHHILLLFLVGFQFGELLCVVQDGHAGRQTGNCIDNNNNGQMTKIRFLSASEFVPSTWME